MALHTLALQEEIVRLLQACSPTAPTGIRNRALIVLLWRGGLRIGEALKLKPADVDAKAGTVRVLHGKGDRSRVVGLDPLAFDALARWMDVRAHLGVNGHAPVFCTLKAKKLSTAYVRALLPRLAAKAGIEKRVHAHGLRHSHAVELVQEGVPLHVIRRQLGHASLETTARYLDHLHPQDVVEAMQARTWKSVLRQAALGIGALAIGAAPIAESLKEHDEYQAGPSFVTLPPGGPAPDIPERHPGPEDTRGANHYDSGAMSTGEDLWRV